MIVQGSGEPLPSLSWRREGGPLPDGDMSHYDNDKMMMIIMIMIMMMMLLGSDHLAGDTLVLAPVSRDHAGTYTCTGGGHRDTLTVTVQCEY